MTLCEYNRATGIRLCWMAGQWIVITGGDTLYLGDCDVSEALEEFDGAVERARLMS